MAKKEDKITSRVLERTIGGITGTVGQNDTVTISKGTGWQHVFKSGQHFFYKVKSFDLSGYTIDSRTTYIQAALFQDMGQLPLGSPAANLQRATMCSLTPLDTEDLTILDVAGQWQLPGSLESNHTVSQIVRGRMEVYVTLSTYAGLQLIGTKEWGTADSTAADKLWVCDAIVVPNVNNTVFSVPDQNFVIPIVVAEEPDLEYIMRLKRSTQPIYKDKTE